MPTSTLHRNWRGHRDTLGSLLEGLQVISNDWTYIYVNPAAAGHAHMVPEALHGRRVTEVFAGIESTPVFAAMQKTMIERTSTSLETKFTFADGSSRWFDIRVMPVPEGVCVLSIDIQARKEAEAALREKEGLAKLGEMAAMIAHEVRNPLAGLSAAVQTLCREHANRTTDTSLFADMLGSINALDRLVSELLLYARPMKVECGPVALDTAINDALRFVEPVPHEVRLELPSPAPIVCADRELLTSVFRNLLLNAVQAMTPLTRPGTIRIHADMSDNACTVQVTDEGPGVPATISDRLFEPFVTGRRTGNGLGLAMSRRIMRVHGGDLDFDRQAPHTTFVVTIPLQC